MSGEQSRQQGGGLERAGRGWWRYLVSMLAIAAAGCPTYEDSYSGTYREESPDPTGGASGRLSVELDFFRYGDRSKAILRYYKPDIIDNDPYGEQTFCTWTWADDLNAEAGKFELDVRKSSTIPDGRLVGEIQSSDRVKLSLYDTEAGEKEWGGISMERVGAEPATECAGPQEFLVLPTFNLPSGDANRLPAGVDYDIEHPVLSVQWVGLQRQVSQGSDPAYGAVRSQGWTGRLDATNFDPSQDVFKNDLSMLLSPPPDKILSSSRSTQAKFAVGHLVVTDDSESGGKSGWNVGSEPIVALALQSGTLPDAPPQADGSGKALLYVEGSIAELAESLGQTTSGHPRLTGFEGVAEAELADQNFFLADVAVNFRQDVIVQVRIYPKVTTPRVPLKATDRDLGRAFSLPRLFP